jgi:hypothetical protein
VLDEERDFAEFSGESWEAALERSGAVSGAHPEPEDEGVAAVESDDWLDED